VSAEPRDLTRGIGADEVSDGGMIIGRVADEDVVLFPQGRDFFALGAFCTHYHGALAEGLVAGGELRCPLHHACFSLRSGEALRAPALDPVPVWRVERVGGQVFVREKLAPPARRSSVRVRPESVGIVGGGAAGLAAAQMLRREGYDGPVTILSADGSAPYDRPNLSKDYLAGSAPPEWMPLRAPEFYDDNRIELRLGARAVSLDAARRHVTLADGTRREFGALLLATGAEPLKLPVPGAAESQLHYLRSFDDGRSLVARSASAKRVAVVGASFIGLEVAASLRERGLSVDVVAPDQQPLERVLGRELGGFVRKLHEARGVTFHLGETVARVDGRKVTTSGGTTFEADFLVLGVGVRPALELAQQAGLAIDRGVRVDEYLQTSVPGVFAAGDIARWPDPHSGQRLRIEHWVVAERQGQVAARNILGARERFDAVPFFWSQHYDVTLRYVGHAEKWDAVEIEGDLERRDCAVHYKLAGRTLAVVTLARDLRSLEAELEMERRS
jgi:apoptosis-inducing factor 3